MKRGSLNHHLRGTKSQEVMYLMTMRKRKIRKVIYAMYENNEHVTLTKLLKVVRKDQLFLSLASVRN